MFFRITSLWKNEHTFSKKVKKIPNSFEYKFVSRSILRKNFLLLIVNIRYLEVKTFSKPFFFINRQKCE